MAKSKKAKSKTVARRKSAAKGRRASTRAAKSRAKHAVSRPRQTVLKAKLSKPLPKGAVPPKVAGKVPQRMDKAALKKALLDERIACGGPRRRRGGARGRRTPLPTP